MVIGKYVLVGRYMQNKGPVYNRLKPSVCALFSVSTGTIFRAGWHLYATKCSCSKGYGALLAF